MRTGTAFEFLGNMASCAGKFGQSNADARWQLFNSSIGLLDVVESVVSLWELQRTTRLMRTVYSSSMFTDFINEHQEFAEKEIAFTEEAERKCHNVQTDIKRSEATELIVSAKLAIKTQQEQYRKKFAKDLGESNNQANRVSNEDTEIHELRNLFSDVILISQSAIEELRENEISNRLKIAELDENIRKTTLLLCRTFENAL